MKPRGSGLVAAVRSIVIASALTSVMAGCGSIAGGTDGPASMEQVTDRAAEILDVSNEQLEAAEVVELPPSTCEIHGFWEIGSLNPHPLHVANLPDGTLVDYDTDRAAETIVNACFTNPAGGDAGSESTPSAQPPSATAVAEVVVRFGRGLGVVDLADRASARRRLAEAGTEYHEPTLAASADGTTIRFFARDLELHGYLEITAHWAGDGTLTIDHIDW